MNRFLILDGHAIIYRAYHAFPDLTDSTGQLTNAIYGFSRILLKSINDFQPEYIAVAFDHREGKSKRVKSFEAYKAHRKPMPDDLIPQIPIIKQVVESFNIPQFELSGFEADDILGTIAKIMAKDNAEKSEKERVLTTIVTGDKDILQLVDDTNTHVFIPGRGRFTQDVEYNEALVLDKMKVRANQIIDLKALMGDPSDNIPGVKGVGAKTATKLINEFEDLSKVYEKVAELEKSGEAKGHPVLKGAILKKMIAEREMAFLSQELATILLDAPVDFSLEKCVVRDYSKDKVAEFFDRYNFTSLKRMLPKDKFEISVQEALF
jgi:DNA polymerase I